MWSVFLAILLDRLLGYPRPIQNKIGHPVEWVGALLTKIEGFLNTTGIGPARLKVRGSATLLILLISVAIPTALISAFLAQFAYGWAVNALLATSLVAQHSLRLHIQAVSQGLSNSLDEGRKAVSRVVGRDPESLDESGVAKAALESLAENTSDGVVAPVFWYALLGLPGIAMYKAINTADSMIGHKSERYLHFGWAAARLDDLVNLPASRLTGLLFASVAALGEPKRGLAALKTMWRDAPKHRSPNAGWPEAALAAILEVSLGGPRSYQGELVDLPWMGDGRKDLTRSDIEAGLRVFGFAMSLLLALALLAALLS